MDARTFASVTRDASIVVPANESLGAVAALWRFPIKALAAESLLEATVLADGIDGDRARALQVRSGHARVGKPYRGKEERRMQLFASSDDAIACARETGVALDEIAGTHFFDAAPISLMFDAWVRDVEALAGRAIDERAFRSNILVAAIDDTIAREAAFVGVLLAVGAVRLRVLAPIVRCVTPSYDIATAIPDPALHAAYVRHRNNEVGIYCEVVTPGTIRLGDTVTRS